MSPSTYMSCPVNLVKGRPISFNNPLYKELKKSGEVKSYPEYIELIEPILLPQEHRHFSQLTRSEKKRYVPILLKFIYYHFIQFTRQDYEVFGKIWDQETNTFNKINSQIKVCKARVVDGVDASTGKPVLVNAGFDLTSLLRIYSYPVLTQSQIQYKYYYPILRPQSQVLYPRYFALDIDEFGGVESNGMCDALHDRIEEIRACIGELTPVIFTSTSSNPNKCHIYFFLDDQIHEKLTRDELRELFAFRLKMTNIRRCSSMEDFPCAKGIVPPLVMGSRLLTKNDEGRYVPYQLDNGRNEMINSMEYLMNQFLNGSIKTLNLSLVKKWKQEMREKPLPLINHDRRKQDTRATGYVPTDLEVYGMMNYSTDIMDIHFPEFDGVLTRSFLQLVIVPIELNSSSPDKPDPSVSLPRICSWIRRELVKGVNSNKGTEFWTDPDQDGGVYPIFQYMLERNRNGEMRGRDCSHEIYQYLYEKVLESDLEPDPSNRQTGDIKISALKLICRFFACIFQTHIDFGCDVDETDGFWVYDFYCSKTYIKSWGIKNTIRSSKKMEQVAEEGKVLVSDSGKTMDLTRLELDVKPPKKYINYLDQILRAMRGVKLIYPISHIPKIAPFRIQMELPFNVLDETRFYRWYNDPDRCLMENYTDKQLLDLGATKRQLKPLRAKFPEPKGSEPQS